jgi:hypothetical protein
MPEYLDDELDIADIDNDDMGAEDDDDWYGDEKPSTQEMERGRAAAKKIFGDMKKKERRQAWIGEILGAGLVIFGILTGTMFIVIPLIVIGFIWLYARGRG